MNLYIPAIGDLIRLTSDWTFDLRSEERNSTLMEKMNDTRKVYSKWQTYATNAAPPFMVTIPAGAVLKIDRIYIKKGSPEFNSITFMWKGESTEPRIEQIRDWRSKDPTATKPNKIPRKPIRFWAKLSDANNIQFEPA